MLGPSKNKSWGKVRTFTGWVSVFSKSKWGKPSLPTWPNFATGNMWLLVSICVFGQLGNLCVFNNHSNLLSLVHSLPVSFSFGIWPPVQDVGGFAWYSEKQKYAFLILYLRSSHGHIEYSLGFGSLNVYSCRSVSELSATVLWITHEAIMSATVCLFLSLEFTFLLCLGCWEAFSTLGHPPSLCKLAFSAPLLFGMLPWPHSPPRPCLPGSWLSCNCLGWKWIISHLGSWKILLRCLFHLGVPPVCTLLASAALLPGQQRQHKVGTYWVQVFFSNIWELCSMKKLFMSLVFYGIETVMAVACLLVPILKGFLS